jgi:hypothetical protein
VKNNPESIALSWKTILEGNYSKDKIAGYISNHFSLNKMISEYEQILELK